MMSCCTKKTTQTFRCPCEAISFWIGYFQSPSEVQLNSLLKTIGL